MVRIGRYAACITAVSPDVSAFEALKRLYWPQKVAMTRLFFAAVFAALPALQLAVGAQATPAPTQSERSRAAGAQTRVEGPKRAPSQAPTPVPSHTTATAAFGATEQTALV